MFDAYSSNDILQSQIEMVVGYADRLEAAEAAFQATRGDFTAKFTAAVQASLVPSARPEVFIQIPADPSGLSKSELERLVRPAAAGFLRSYPTRLELVEQLQAIGRRQQRRPSWVPRIDVDGNPWKEALDLFAVQEREPDREVAVSSFGELGDVTIVLPQAGAAGERPELEMEPGGIGELESVLHAALGVSGPRTSESTVTLDDAANMALVPDEARWWPDELAEAKTAAEDPGVASELLATTATLGGQPVADDTLASVETVAGALSSAGDWRYSPRWSMEAWGPGDDVPTVVSARAALKGWANERGSGVIVYVYGGSLHAEEAQFGFPGPLHSYLLAAARSVDGTDTIGSVHRIVLSCPGEHWCHRGGCVGPGFPEVANVLHGVVTAGDAADVAFGGAGVAAEVYQNLYGDVDGGEYTESVMEFVMGELSGSEWIELERSEWEGGIEQSLLRRREHCLTVLYDPVTRQLRLCDGKHELESVLQVPLDDDVLLAAAEDALCGRIKEIESAALPAQATILGLHPHADGELRAPDAHALAERQLGVLLRAAGVLSDRE